ncbi:hypothetical protein LSAT2_015576 [Lamellibrachia satsuma]|nr:hypothetical protein LSAT2_015576 [Lamellibrachia satsuma]
MSSALDVKEAGHVSNLTFTSITTMKITNAQTREFDQQSGDTAMQQHRAPMSLQCDVTQRLSNETLVTV